jgi:hypothetical protein
VKSGRLCKRGWGIVLVLGLVATGLSRESHAAATSGEHEEDCRRQLYLIAEAIASYRQDHGGSFPARLGELWPRYVSDARVFCCPAAMARGRGGPANPSLIVPGEPDGQVIGYTWELSLEDPNFWDRAGYDMTFARFKELQMRSLVGRFLPVVRCSHHGEDRFLNLTVDGTIYESGEYWECNFVDRLSGVRLAPQLVGWADRPMSELVRPRPADAVDSMLDLRPWYNARFEDPWVHCNVGEETLRPGSALEQGVITSLGIRFDAAGIIQLNGLIDRSGGEGGGFNRLVYPKAVNSIPVRRSFRVLHVLGAVLFEDAMGTPVGRIRLHRNGSGVEEWVWRYGEDVLRYRFALGAAERALGTPVVAWTGEFAHPEGRGWRARLFHMRYETTDPGVPVDHLDFLAGDGVSSAFVAAISFE